MTGLIWNEKKPNGPQTAVPEPKNPQTDKKSPGTTRPVDSRTDRSPVCLGQSLRVKGDITGTEDLLVDGSIEIIQLDERKLTVGRAAELSPPATSGTRPYPDRSRSSKPEVSPVTAIPSEAKNPRDLRFLAPHVI